MTDDLARKQAIDPTRSFIVQAPAGSGKTELLIQRYLGLLSRVQMPEEILAITFTRKATEEMRTRITQALIKAQNPEDEDLPSHQKTTRNLAKAVLKQNEEKQWRLLDFPRRLRISTIDAFCANLVRQMPFLSRMGAMPQILEPATPIYEEAIQRMLQVAHTQPELQAKLQKLLRHMDNDWRGIQERLVRALMARDQWLQHVVEGKSDLSNAREQMTHFLKHQVDTKVRTLNQLLGPAHRVLLFNLASYAHHNTPDQPGWWSEWVLSPDESLTLTHFNNLYSLLFVGTGKIRKSINIKNGFPSAKDASVVGTAFETAEEAKKECTALIQDLHTNGFAQELRPIENFPDPAYSESQWEIVALLMDLLFHLVTELWVVNKEKGQVDFVEMALAAHHALGHHTDPTELLLHLDYQIQHILIDEFQDTSRAQVALFTQLVSGWQPDEGRTLFVVGDPMQSIYAFRKADVGNYLRANENGIGGVDLERLQLERNFRSKSGIVNWVNQVFKEVFPLEEDVILGQVAYAPSEPTRFDSKEALVQLHLLQDATLDVESEHTLALIEDRLSEGLKEGEKIAVLVRSRGRLRKLIPLLTQKEIPFAAVDIFELSQEAIIQDLSSLSVALHYLYDRQAWVALLRSPFCGLSLASLTCVTQQKKNLIWENLCNEEILINLAPSERTRLEGFTEILRRHFEKGPQKRVRAFVEGLFHEFGGPGLYTSQELEVADVFFRLLEQMETQVGGFSKTDLQKELKDLKAPSTDMNAPVQLMTIHKSKGLEFDTVILLGLGAAPKANAYELLAHFEWCLSDDEKGLLFAPIHATGEDKDPIQKFIRYLRKSQSDNEIQRLLYVAATRAKNNLHLVAKGEINNKEEIKWRKNSLMEILGPPLERLGLVALQNVAHPDLEITEEVPWLRRIASFDDVPPPEELWAAPPVRHESVDVTLGFDASVRAKIIGIVTHQYMEWMGQDELAGWNTQRFVREATAIENMLLREGLPRSEISVAKQQVLDALEFVIQDEKGRWILGAQKQARSEWPVCYLNDDGQFQNMVIDRSFIDVDNNRWIIDFKTGLHHGGDLEAYLSTQKEKYQSQLEKYARVLQAMEDKPIKLGLYFPFPHGFYHWDFDPTAV